MIIHNLNFTCPSVSFIFFICLLPDKADTPLIVNENTVLAETVVLQGFKPVAWRHAQAVQTHGRVKLKQFSQCCRLHICRQLPGNLVPKDFRRFGIAEVDNHDKSVSHHDTLCQERVRFALQILMS